MKTSRYQAVGIAAAGAVAGAVLASSLGAMAASSSTSSAGASSSPSSSENVDHGGGHAGETALTGTDLAKARAAAQKAVPGGTIVRIETDGGDAVYEAHMTKSDGTLVTVKFGKSFKVTAVEDGMGR